VRHDTTTESGRTSAALDDAPTVPLRMKGWLGECFGGWARFHFPWRHFCHAAKSSRLRRRVTSRQSSQPALRRESCHGGHINRGEPDNVTTNTTLRQAHASYILARTFARHCEIRRPSNSCQLLPSCTQLPWTFRGRSGRGAGHMSLPEVDVVAVLGLEVSSSDSRKPALFYCHPWRRLSGKPTSNAISCDCCSKSMRGHLTKFVLPQVRLTLPVSSHLVM
jgi:hypothetical protein